MWPLTIPQKKKLDAAHHKFQRRLLGITWNDKVCNENIRNQTKLPRMDLTERRLRWLGHLLRMEDDRIPKQAIRWQMDSCTRRRPGRPRSEIKLHVDWHRNARFEVNWHGLGRGRTSSSRQRRLAWTCGPMCLPHGLNSGLRSGVYVTCAVIRREDRN